MSGGPHSTSLPLATFVTIPAANGVRVKSRQTGSTVLSTTTTDVAITAVDRSKSVIFMTYRLSTNELRHIPCAYLTSTTNLRLEILVGGGSATVEWTVVEFGGPITVQYGTTSWMDATTADVAITAVVLKRAFVVMSWAIDLIDTRYIPTAHLSSTTNLRFTRGLAGAGITTKTAWFVVEVG